MDCLYIGKFNETHTEYNKKRRLIGTAKEKALTSIIDKNIACQTYREKEALRLMKIGKFNLSSFIHFSSSKNYYFV